MFSFRSITRIVRPFLFSHQQTINFLLYPALCFYFFKTVFLLHIRVFGSIYLTHKHPVWSGTCFIRRIQCLINHQLLTIFCMLRKSQNPVQVLRCFQIYIFPFKMLDYITNMKSTFFHFELVLLMHRHMYHFLEGFSKMLIILRCSFS